MCQSAIRSEPLSCLVLSCPVLLRCDLRQSAKVIVVVVVAAAIGTAKSRKRILDASDGLLKTTKSPSIARPPAPTTSARNKPLWQGFFPPTLAST